MLCWRAGPCLSRAISSQWLCWCSREQSRGGNCPSGIISNLRGFVFHASIKQQGNTLTEHYRSFSQGHGIVQGRRKRSRRYRVSAGLLESSTLIPLKPYSEQHFPEVATWETYAGEHWPPLVWLPPGFSGPYVESLSLNANFPASRNRSYRLLWQDSTPG